MQLKKITILSVEGNWNEKVHFARIRCAGEFLSNSQDCFVIASGTFAPHPTNSFTKEPLGLITAMNLIGWYGINPEQILPAYLFPLVCTYTTLDAYTNSLVIGWLASESLKREEQIEFVFVPVTSDFHAERVFLLNERALEPLRTQGLKIKLGEPLTTKLPVTENETSNERQKVQDLRDSEGVINTGTWVEGSSRRTFDDLEQRGKDLRSLPGVSELLDEQNQDCNFEKYLTSVRSWAASTHHSQMVLDRPLFVSRAFNEQNDLAP